MDLIKLLTEQLGVTQEQARGGAGLVFDLAKQKLGAAEFAEIEKVIPKAQAWMSEAPTGAADGGGLLGMAGSLASKLGFDNLGQLASLAEGFKKLDLDADMIAKFIPVIMKFVDSLGSENIKAILAKVLAK